MLSKRYVKREGTAPASSPTELDRLVGGYSLFARAEGHSAKSIAIVIYSITYLDRFLKSEGMTTDVTKISTPQIRAFILYLQNKKCCSGHRFTKPQEKGLSGHSINCYLRSVRIFWSWAQAEGYIFENPFVTFKIPKAPKRIIPTMSVEELSSLVGAIDISNPQGYRDYTITILLIDTGLRVSELTSLEIDDINLERRIFKVWGKGAKERVVPFGVRSHKALLNYLTFHRPQPATPRTREFFLTFSGEPLKIRRVQAMIKRYAKKAGIKGIRCSPHTLRHTAALLWIRNGGDVLSLQQILGHSTLEMVRVYVNLAQSDIEAAHRKYSPVDNMDLKSPIRRPKQGTTRPTLLPNSQ